MVRLILFVLLVVTTLPAVAQVSADRQEDRRRRSPAFWDRLEREIDLFLARLTGDFAGPDTADTARVGPGGTVSQRSDTVATEGLHAAWIDSPERDPESFWERRRWQERGPSPRRHDRFREMPAPWISDLATSPPVIFRYNRVEGLFLGLGSRKQYHWEGDRLFSTYGSIGYGFGAHRWRGNLGVARQFAIPSQETDRIFEIGVEVYSLADSRDRWRLTTAENTAAALLIHEEFRDYYGREGGTIRLGFASRTDTDFLEAGAAFAADRYRSIPNQSEWAVFGGGKRYRENPAIDEGVMRSVTISAGYSSAEKTWRGPEGWSLSGSAEFADRSVFGGGFQFQQYVADVRRYQPLGEHDQLNMRLRFGTSGGALPRQRAFTLGGPATLPGYAFNALPADTLSGNRLLLLNIEYRLNGDFLGELSFWPSWLMRHVNLLLMFDAGIVRAAETGSPLFSGFGGAGWNDVQSDVGVGVTNRNGSFRLAVVWPTDRAAPGRLLVRFSRPF